MASKPPFEIIPEVDSAIDANSIPADHLSIVKDQIDAALNQSEIPKKADIPFIDEFSFDLLTSKIAQRT